jgi:2-acetylphloroglucinol acetyltransferase
MERRVSIIGTGITKHVAYDVERTWKEMLAEAVFGALDDCDMKPGELQGGVVAYHGEAMIDTGNIGPLISDVVGMEPAGVTGISVACAGGSVALYHGYALVASGLCDVALVAGFEKGSELYEYVETIGNSSESDYDYNFGLTHLDWLGLITLRYQQKYEMPDWESVATWIEDRHWFARRHPKSFYFGQGMPSRRDLQRNMMHWAAARADGAAALILTTDAIAKRLRKRPVYIDGLGFASASAYLPHRFHHAWQNPEADIADSELTRVAADKAYRMAGLKDVQEINLLEISDGSPGVTFVELEALGLYPRGGAWKGVLAGEHGLTGRFPTNTHGGSIAFGHASGAAALVSVVEAVAQMRGEAGERQVPGPVNTSLCQASGGSNSNNTVTVLRRE